jgi:hypothetical protein
VAGNFYIHSTNLTSLNLRYLLLFLYIEPSVNEKITEAAMCGSKRNGREEKRDDAAAISSH